jgi:hypothetical protein
MFVNADGTLGLFENGFRQNVLFLYHLFRAMPACARAILVNAGDGALSEDISRFGVDPADVMTLPACADQLDVLICAGAAIAPDDLQRLRDRGARTIAYKAGNGAIISIEAVVSRGARQDGERYFDAGCYDEVWLTPQHWRTFRGWCETIYRCPVRQTPHAWSPLIVDAIAGPDFGYTPGARPWRIGVMDPNITVMKTSHLPMLVCEAAFRQCPDEFAAFYIANGFAHRENIHFASFTTSLTAAQAGKMTLEPRFIGGIFLRDHCDAVVTHQWENALNYLYWEALHGGYPLIHNSPLVDPAGYPYPDFDAEAGGAQLLRAKAAHDDTLPAYRDRARALLASLDPTSAAQIASHEAAIMALLR